MKGTTIEIDLAKNVLEIYVEDEAGQVVERRQLSRKREHHSEMGSPRHPRHATRGDLSPNTCAAQVMGAEETHA